MSRSRAVLAQDYPPKAAAAVAFGWAGLWGPEGCRSQESGLGRLLSVGFRSEAAAKPCVCKECEIQPEDSAVGQAGETPV